MSKSALSPNGRNGKRQGQRCDARNCVVEGQSESERLTKGRRNADGLSARPPQNWLSDNLKRFSVRPFGVGISCLPCLLSHSWRAEMKTPTNPPWQPRKKKPPTKSGVSLGNCTTPSPTAFHKDLPFGYFRHSLRVAGGVVQLRGGQLG